MLGILIAALCHKTVVILGVATILVANAGLFQVLKLCGAAYLVWMGLSLWRRGDRLATAGAPGNTARLPIVRRAFLISMSNPKAIFAYLAVFSQFISPGEPLAAQLVVLVPTALAVTAAVYIGYCAIGSGVGRFRNTMRRRLALNREIGTFYVFAGAALAASGRQLRAENPPGTLRRLDPSGPRGFIAKADALPSANRGSALTRPIRACCAKRERQGKSQKIHRKAWEEVLMRRYFLKGIAAFGATLFAIGAFTSSAGAETLLEKAKAGEPIRIGFANEVPWAYPGENNKPLGFANKHAVGVLNAMGITNIEPVVTEWGGLIPGLKANRFDVITGGMYILGSRCENVNFAEPMGVFGDAFIVAKGNPKGIQTYQDIKKAGAVLATGAGYNIVEVAKKEGIPESNIMQVPGPTEILAAVKAGRADAGGVTFFTAQNLAKESGGAVEVTDPSKLPEWTLNWVGIAFRKSDTDFLKAFNEAQAKYIGSPEMLKAVGEFGYTKAQLPGDATTAHACANR